MLNEIYQDAEAHMEKAIDALNNAFKRIRTGRANPDILDSVYINYYGTATPLAQVANVSVEDGRTLSIKPWEKPMVPEIEKAIMKSDLGLNPATNGDTIRVAMPALTEETRKDMQKVARAEAEKGRVSIRNARRDAISDIKELVKEKELSEDEGRKGEEQVQKLTDKWIAVADKQLADKEADLMKV